jgi:hypothetical protein
MDDELPREQARSHSSEKLVVWEMGHAVLRVAVVVVVVVVVVMVMVVVLLMVVAQAAAAVVGEVEAAVGEEKKQKPATRIYPNLDAHR